MQIAQAKSNNDKIIQLSISSLKSMGIPESEAAEMALIAAVLYKPQLFHEVAALLDDDAWFYIKHALIWDAMNALVNDASEIDTVTLSEKLLQTEFPTQESALHAAGGPTYFTQLLSDNMQARNYRDYINIINSAFRRRCMLAASDELKKAAMDYETTAVKSINNAYSSLDRLADKHRTFTTIGDGLHAHMDIAEAARNNPIAMGIPSGIAALDKKIDGFHKRKVYIIGARPEDGKTATLMTIALYAASQGVRVGIFNVADGNTQDVISRLIGMESSIKAHDILMGRCAAQEYERYFEASRKVGKYPIYIESEMGMTLPALLVKARNMKYRFGLDMVMIDYAQEIGIDTSHASAPQHRVDQLRYIASMMPRLASEEFLDVPVLLAAQLNRGAVGRVPVSSDIKGSGAFEQVADCVILPYWEDHSVRNMELIIAKNRITNTRGVIDVTINAVSSKIESAW